VFIMDSRFHGNDTNVITDITYENLTELQGQIERITYNNVAGGFMRLSAKVQFNRACSYLNKVNSYHNQ
jgi:hypothetical protein